MVSPRRRRRPLPDRRHLVADRDGRHPDHAAAGRDRPEARLGDAAVLRRAARRSSTTRARCSRARARATSCSPTAGPGQMRTVFGDHQRFIDTYFRTFPGRYFTGDGAQARRGRLLLDHRPRRRRAQRRRPSARHRRDRERARGARSWSPRPPWSAARTTSRGRASTPTSRWWWTRTPTEELRKELREWVRREIGPIATPDFIQWAPGLPKTRSGKIMRRILRKIAAQRARAARRHLDAGRSVGGGAARREPDEPVIHRAYGRPAPT